jgi:NAD-dependent SIR2 family protein deacetylase
MEGENLKCILKEYRLNTNASFFLGAGFSADAGIPAQKKVTPNLFVQV